MWDMVIKHLHIDNLDLKKFDEKMKTHKKTTLLWKHGGKKRHKDHLAGCNCLPLLTSNKAFSVIEELFGMYNM